MSEVHTIIGLRPCCAELTVGLQRGDSGSWIVNPDTGVVYGQVVAKMGASVFMLPMKTLIDEIEAQRESSGSQVTALLPSPSILLTDLAEYHRYILGDTEVAYRYEQAASRATHRDKSKDTSPFLRPTSVPAGPLGTSESAVSKPLWPDPALKPFPGMHGRATAKEHPPSTSTRSVERPTHDAAKHSKSSVRPMGDISAQYTHMELFEREKFYQSLHASDQIRIDAYLRRVTQIRGAMASGKHSSLIDNILSSMKIWRDTIDDRNVPGWRRERRGMSPGPELSKESMHQDATIHKLLEYDPLMDIDATKTRYSRNDGWSGPPVDEEQEVISLKELFRNPARWLQKGMSSENVTGVTHIHIPATNIEVRTVTRKIGSDGSFV